MDADFFEPADWIDPAYGKELRTAVRNGVELFAYDVKLTLESISLNRRVPHRL
jgi:sugar fermentation stimulation protein A